MSLDEFTEKQNEIIDDIVERQLKQKIRLKQSVTRNVMFVGKSRCGKSTIFEVLKDPGYITQQLSIYRGTFEPKLHSFVVEKTYNDEQEYETALKKILSEKQKKAIKREENEKKSFDQQMDEFRNKAGKEIKKRILQRLQKLKQENKLYNINFNVNIIDTPGLFENTAEGSVSRDNDTIRETILRCLRQEIKEIHAIFFVCSFEEGVNRQDIAAFKEFISLFQGAEQNIALIITRSETKTTRHKSSITKQLQKDIELQKLLKVKGEDRKIFFFGATSHIARGNHFDDKVALSLKNVSKMRDDLFEFIFNINKPCHMDQIQFIKSKGDDILKLQKQLLKLLKEKLNGSSDDNAKIAQLGKKIQANAGFIISEEGKKLRNECDQVYGELDEQLLEKQKQLSAHLNEYKTNSTTDLEEAIKTTREYIEKNQDFVRSVSSTQLFKKNDELFKSLVFTK